MHARTELSHLAEKPLLPEDTRLRSRLDCLEKSHHAPIRIDRMAGDASTRTYFRAWYPDGSTAVIMLQPEPGLGQEASFLDVHRFLERLGLPVPMINFHDSEQGIIVLEDMGDELLEAAAANAKPETIRALYTNAVDLLVRMRHKTRNISSGCCAFDLAFDQRKLMEELEFFMTHFVKGLCGSDLSADGASALRRFFTVISEILASEPRVFTHRDFHSRNLILHRGRLFMIDFQDARMGPAQYDLASLLRDSYVTLPEALVDDMIVYYRSQTGDDDEERFRFIFDVMSLQRNIKAMGTFAYQISVRGSLRYASSIPRTAQYIGRTIGLHQELSEFRSVVEDYISGPGEQGYL